MATTGLDSFTQVIVGLLQNPPDPNEPVPMANRFEFTIGVTTPFFIFSLIAVGLRLYTRLRITRQPGWDDALVTVAALLNTVYHISFLGGLKHGLGHHFIYILDIIPDTMKWFYVAHATYTSTTVVIKLSLLSQYLRLFHDKYRRNVTLLSIVVVTLWGLSFMFLTWFPCFPVSGFWAQSFTKAAHCYALGKPVTAKTILISFAASNMFLDTVVFLIPLTEYFRPNLERRQILAMTGLFAVGLVVLLMAALRMWSGLKYTGDIGQYDFAFWLPELLLFSCLEVDFATICASIPIFWPTVVAAWAHIYVTNEVIVTSEPRVGERQKRQEEDIELEQDRKSYKSTEGLVIDTWMVAKPNVVGGQFHVQHP